MGRRGIAIVVACITAVGGIAAVALLPRPAGTPVAKDAEAPARPVERKVEGEGPPAPPARAAARTGVLRAFLVRSRTGKPIPGRMTVSGPAGFTREVASGAGGGLIVDGLPRCVPLDVTVSSPGLLPRRIRSILLPATGEESLGSIPVGEAVSVEVVVRTSGESPMITDEEAPLPGATVEVREAGPDDGLEEGPRPVASATTGEDGRATLAGVPPGDWVLVVRARGRGAEHLPLALVEGARRSPVEIVLGPGHGFEGRILAPDGSPAAGIGVLLVHPVSLCVAASGSADPRGRFRFEDLSEVHYPLAVKMPGGVVEAIGRAEVPSPGPSDFGIGSRGELRGRIVDEATGMPVPGATLGVSIWAYSFGGPPRFLESAADGTFHVSGIPLAAGGPGGGGQVMFLSLTVEKEGYLPAGFSPIGPEEPAPRIVPAGSPPDPAKSFEVRLRRGGAVLGGVVRDREGKPVPDAWITLGHGDPRGDWSTVHACSDADGRYRLPPAPPGPGILLAGAYGLHLAGMASGPYEEPIPPERRIDIPASGEVARDLVLFPDSAVEGRMVFSDGSPAEGFFPVLSSRTTIGPLGAPSAADGSFSIEELSPGSQWVVGADGPSGRVGASEPFDLAESERVTGIVVRVVRPASVAGRVLGPGGKPAPGTFVRLEEGRADPEQPWDGEMPGFGATFLEVAEDGSFRADDIPAGAWTPYASAPGLLPARGESFEVGEGERKEGLVLVLAEGRSVAGRVLDPSGSPVAEAAVLAFRIPVPREGVPGNILIKPWGAGNPDQMVLAGPDGTFRITGLPEGRCVLAATMEGFVGIVVGVQAGDVGLVLRLGAEFPITGRVLDPDGSPVEEARVVAEGAAGEAEVPPGGEEEEPGGSLSRLEELLTEELRGLGSSVTFDTGPDGAFRIGGLAKGTFRLVASKRGFLDATATVEAGTPDVVLRLGRGFTIEGRVVEAGTGKPIPEASIRATPVSSPAAGPDAPDPRAVWAQVERNGTFVVEGAQEGTYSLRIEPPGMFGQRAFLPRTIHGVRTGTKDLVAEVDRGLSLSGRAVDAEGGEFRGAGLLIGLHRTGDPVPPWGGAQRLLGEDGRFTFSGLLPGRYSVTISPVEGGEEPPMYFAARVEADAGTGDLVVPLALGKTIGGRVELPEGRPVDEGAVWLEVRSSRGTGFPVEVEDVPIREDGSFLTPPLDPGVAWDLLARAGDEGVAAARGIRPGATGVVLKIEPGRAIEGVVVGPEGKPVAGARVEARARAGGQRETGAYCDEDGSFVLEGLAPGSYLLYGGSYEANLAPVEPEAPVAAGSAGAVVRTAAGNEFRARFVLAGGGVPSGEDLTVFVQEMAGGRCDNHSWPLREEGKFVLGGLGRCRIRLYLIRDGDTVDLDDPQSGATFGPFDVPCDEQILVVEE